MARPRKDIRHRCRDCWFSHSPHERDCNGEFFLCRCPHRNYSQFLDIWQECDKFKQKKDLDNGNQHH